MPDDIWQKQSPESLEAELAADLKSGLQTLSVQLSDAQQATLIAYVLLLKRWNRVHNLTAVRDVREMISRHLLDSLTLLPHLGAEIETLVDVGSGAGLPGIPLAVSRPELSCLMVDSSSRKTRFIHQAITTLSLTNAEVQHSRIQDLQRSPADCIVARAFSSPVDIINSARHLCAEGGKMIFMMGHVEGLLENLPDSFEMEAVHPVVVPGSEATRHIAICRRSV